MSPTCLWSARSAVPEDGGAVDELRAVDARRSPPGAEGAYESPSAKGRDACHAQSRATAVDFVAMDSLVAPMVDAEHYQVGGVDADVVRVGNARVKRVVYPTGFRWSTHMKPVVGTDTCTHTHVGFLARGHIAGEYADGCTFDFEAPAAVVVDAGHDGWVVGDEPAVLIEIDHEADTAERLGLPSRHQH